MVLSSNCLYSSIVGTLVSSGVACQIEYARIRTRRPAASESPLRVVVELKFATSDAAFLPDCRLEASIVIGVMDEPEYFAPTFVVLILLSSLQKTSVVAAKGDPVARHAASQCNPS